MGTEGKIFSKSFVQNQQNPPVGIGEKNFSETVSFYPPPRLPDEGTNIFSEKLDHLDGFPPVGIGDGTKPSGKDDQKYV